ncbi:MAG: hypothetical protein HBSAPP03_00080 [Phycisphaerae bacterium]|nr:MAG: hypothetical protein HBSAPP03_00080 [Phycisphaerae bacterium]
MDHFRLRSLPLAVRLAIVCVCGVLGIGLSASLQHMRWHYEKRDERAGFTLDDVRGAYHGMRSISPLRQALERGHPPAMPLADRDALLDWLLGKKDAAGNRPKEGNPKLSTDFDNLDLGERAPAEIMRANCLSCHGRGATDPIAKTYPLEFWDDVKAISFSREINPTDPKKLAISIHAHALSLGTMLVVIAGLFWCTGWPRRLVGWVTFLAAAGLLADFAGQLASRAWEPGIYLIVAGGALGNGLMALMLVGISADVLRPAKTPSA